MIKPVKVHCSHCGRWSLCILNQFERWVCVQAKECIAVRKRMDRAAARLVKVPWPRCSRCGTGHPPERCPAVPGAMRL